MFVMYGGGFDKIICHEYPLLCQIFKSLKVNANTFAFFSLLNGVNS